MNLMDSFKWCLYIVQSTHPIEWTHEFDTNDIWCDIQIIFDARCNGIWCSVHWYSMRVATGFDVRCNDISFAVQCYLMRCTNNISCEVRNSHCICWLVLMIHIATRYLVHKWLDACIERFQTNLIDMHYVNRLHSPCTAFDWCIIFQVHWSFWLIRWTLHANMLCTLHEILVWILHENMTRIARDAWFA
jgi:hypothetical protein